MNFLSIKYFITVVENKNITKAARELYITQQTLSSHMAALEKEVGSKLFIRSSPIELTYGGRIFYKYALSIQNTYDAMWKELNDVSNVQKGILFIGVSHVVSRYLIAELVEEFQKLYPEIEVRIVESANKDIGDFLSRKRIDIVIGTESNRFKNIEVVPFFKEEIVMVVPKSFAYDKLEENNFILKDIDRFAHLPFILNSAATEMGKFERSLFQAINHIPVVKLQIDNDLAKLSACKKNLGICFLPKMFFNNYVGYELSKDIDVFSFKENSNFDIYFGYRKDSYLWKMISEFVKVSKQLIDSKVK